MLRAKSPRIQKRIADPSGCLEFLHAELRNKIPIRVKGKQLKLPAYEVVLMSVDDRSLVKLALSLKLPFDDVSGTVLINGKPIALKCLRDAAKTIVAKEWYSAASV